MTERGTPVVILFIITIGVLLYQFAAEYRMVNAELQQELLESKIIIDRQKQANDSLVNIVEYLYIQHYGAPLPSDSWKEIQSINDNSPVH